jgi:hypothetical protein
LGPVAAGHRIRAGGISQNMVAIAYSRKKPRGRGIKVVRAVYAGDYRLLITFTDGFSRIVDFRNYLIFSHHRYLRNYRRIENFLKFHIEWGRLMWGDYHMLFHTEDLYRGKIVWRMGKRERRKYEDSLQKRFPKAE